MATTVVKTIGTGGDYSTIQAWEDACPADLVAVDQIWQGQLKNQEFTSGSTVLTVGGMTVDSTRYVELTTESGASFRDHANKATNALRYNASVGAAVRCTGNWNATIRSNVQYFRISNIQIKAAASGNAYISGESGASAYCTVSNCIIESDGGSGAGGAVLYAGNATVKNSVVVALGGTALAYIGSAANLYNCTLIHLGTSAATPIITSYPSGTIRNTYIGGNITALTVGGSTVSNCYTSLGSPPSGFTTAALSTSNFSNVTSGTHDFKLVSGSALINAGTDDSTNAANDIIGTARSSGSYDVGAWEYASSGATATVTGTTATPAFSGSAQVSPLTSITVTTASPTFSGGASTGSAEATITATTASPAFSGSATGDTSQGVITLPVLKNNTGTILANETGATVHVYEVSTGNKVVTKTSQTTNGSGVMTVTDALIVAATQYRVVVVLGSGAEGLDKVTAA